MGFFLRCGQRSWVFTRVEASLSDICRGPWTQHVFTVSYPQSAAGRRSDDSVGPSSNPPPTTPTLSNLIPETSGPDKPANEAFPAALSVCLPSGASNRQCRTLQTASGKIRQPAPPTQPSADTGVIGAVCCKPDSLKTPSISIFPPFFNSDRQMREGRGELTG